MAELATYSPDEVKLQVEKYLCAGWERITIKRSGPMYKFIKGIRNKHTRVRDSDTSAVITISVIQTSQTNEVFSEILRQDYVEQTGRFNLLLKDLSGNSLFSSSEAYLSGFPSVTYEDDITFNEWEIICQTTNNYEIGNNVDLDNNIVNQILNLFS